MGHLGHLGHHPELRDDLRPRRRLDLLVGLDYTGSLGGATLETSCNKKTRLRQQHSLPEGGSCVSARKCVNAWRYSDGDGPAEGREASQALHILDRVHIAAKLNKAIDAVWAAEAKELAAT